MDYRKFLGKEEERVLPYFGGAFLYAADRRLRLATEPEAPGWYRFRVKGREATALGPSEPEGLEALPTVRGHLVGERLVREGSIAERLHFLPEEEPPRLTPARARRWHSGELVFEMLDFESEAEEAARRALEEDASLAQVKGVPATLRSAFAYAVLEAASRRLGIPAAPRELRPHLGNVAEQGRVEAERALRALAAERILAAREMEELNRRRQVAALAQHAALAQEVAVQARVQARRQERGGRHRRGEEDAMARAELALEAAGARMRSVRVLGNGNLEVIFTFMDERFISVVNRDTLQVVDSGICLGHPPSDNLVTLESLPSVIKEAIDTDSLVILRHA
ncbi:hypothetical protein [Hyalangium rubrum]|uniref:Band 7 domain-containing protein n=1 Tax=Hyalangium rubrum TaxID=3103134 RepID=A0ABU5HJR2_9BACT|nr:hypothetical protein [Hyalangium sp. s54d21]MDY7233083.1 hypothetical protein [Hyalangium sp. s54d21]